MFELTLSCALICGFAAFAGGFLDAVSGGGGLLTIPALLLTGVPPHYALGTNKIGACLGTTVALANFARHGVVAWKMAFWGVPFSLAGSWLGSLLALYLESAMLGKILVILLPIAMIATLMPTGKSRNMTQAEQGLRFWLALPLVCLALGCYDGFFGPGTGSFLILLLHWFLRVDLITASATAKAFNLGSNVSAAVTFVWHGTVIWSLGIIMAICFMIGNAIGSAFAIRAGSGAVRKFLVVSMLILLATLVWQYFIAPA
ncbi:MAG: TSUP family transporter [Desulfovibrio sp.]|nr:TSUP family transporter [Desulfovibrio sp.]